MAEVFAKALAQVRKKGRAALLLFWMRTVRGLILPASAILCLTLLAGLSACWIPARRAARIDPILAVRQQ